MEPIDTSYSWGRTTTPYTYPYKYPYTYTVTGTSSSYGIYFTPPDPMQVKLAFKVEYALGDVANYKGYSTKEFTEDEEIFNMIVEDLYCMGSPSEDNPSFVIKIYENNIKDGEEMLIIKLSDIDEYKNIYDMQYRMMDLDCALSEYELDNNDQIEFNILYERFTKMQSSVLLEKLNETIIELVKQKYATQSSSKS